MGLISLHVRPEHVETGSLLRTTVPDFSGSSSLVTASTTTVFTGFMTDVVKPLCSACSGKSAVINPREAPLALSMRPHLHQPEPEVQMDTNGGDVMQSVQEGDV